ncbi:MAG: RNA methyltransferase [Candidatus Sumerlaeota bacterium]|nr:RNA methyltransferase [Candidatus Sumerlaeota bacterium]
MSRTESEISSELFSNVRVVLCRPQIAGNVGAICRLMLNFGPRRLYLVQPKADHLCPEARRRARAGMFILENAVIVETLSEALIGCTHAIGSTARARRTDRMAYRPRQGIELALDSVATDEQIALVFGHETSGMSNLELDQCQVVVTIPTCEDMPSLNVSMAASVLLYELHQAVADRFGKGAWPPMRGEGKTSDPPATLESLEAMYAQAYDALWAGRFFNPQNPDITMRYLRRFFGHAGISDFEVRLWRAIWRRLNNTLRHPKP